MSELTWDALVAQADAATGAPRLSEPALGHRFGARRTWPVHAGQIWRTCSQDTSSLVYLLTVDDSTVSAAPVSLTCHVTPGSAVIAGADNAFAETVGVWLSLRCDLNWGALDTVLDDWAGSAVSGWLSDPVTQHAPDHCWIQEQPASVLDPVWSDEEALAAEMDQLAADFPPLAEQTTADAGQRADMSPSELSELLGVSMPEAVRIRRGQQDLTADQVRQLEEATGQSVSAAGAVPTDGLYETTHPRWHKAAEVLSSQWGLPENAGQRRLVQESMALAARAVGDTSSPWRARVEAYVQSVLGHVPD